MCANGLAKFSWAIKRVISSNRQISKPHKFVYIFKPNQFNWLAGVH